MFRDLFVVLLFVLRVFSGKYLFQHLLYLDSNMVMSLSDCVII